MMEKMKNLFNRIPKKIRISAGSALLLAAILALAGYFYWNKIILKSETNLKVGFVTDWEYASKENVGNKQTRKAPAELEKVVKYYNEEFQPEIVIEGGDMVESSIAKRKKVLEQFQQMNAIFSQLRAKRGYVFGNHDLRDISKEELRNVLGIDYNHTYFDLGNWRLVIADFNFNPDGTEFDSGYYVGGYVPESEFAWLGEVLKTDRPTILFSHYTPLPVVGIDGNWTSNPKNISNGLELHNFLKQFKNLVLVISGHTPGFIEFKNIEGIDYIIAEELTDIRTLGGFANIQAKYNKYTKKARVEFEQMGPNYKKLEINKKIGKFSLW